MSIPHFVGLYINPVAYDSMTGEIHVQVMPGGNPGAVCTMAKSRLRELAMELLEIANDADQGGVPEIAIN